MRGQEAFEKNSITDREFMYIYTLYAGILLLFPFFLLPYFIKFSHDNFSLLSWLSQCFERNRKHEKNMRESVNRWIT